MSWILLRWRAAPVFAAALLFSAGARADAPPVGANPCATAPAEAAPFGANTNRIGLVDLHFFSAQGATVSYFECVDGRAQRLGERSMPGAAITSLFGATPWRCGRLTRHFAASATLPDGTFSRGLTSVRTMSCARRFRLDVPSQVGRGQSVRVRIVDRWQTGGIRTRLCVTPPQSRRDCGDVPFAAAAAAATRRLRLTRRGLWRVELQVAGHRVRETIAVGVKGVRRAPPPPTVLATGDSTMQGVESFLSDDLGNEATVISEVRPGSSFSRSDEWAGVARSQVGRLRPRTTVISLGAAEGFPMRGLDGRAHDCCGEAWVAAYARRVRAAMRVYRQGGRGRVLYLTIPAPRQPARATIVSAVNTAIVRAADGLPGVRVLRMDLLFSPSGYQERLRYRGRDVPVREPDGIHLNASGTAITAREVAQAIRAGGRRGTSGSRAHATEPG